MNTCVYDNVVEMCVCVCVSAKHLSYFFLVVKWIGEKVAISSHVKITVTLNVVVCVLSSAAIYITRQKHFKNSQKPSIHTL